MRQHALHSIKCIQRIVLRNEQLGWKPLPWPTIEAIKLNNSVVASHGLPEDKITYCRILYYGRTSNLEGSKQYNDYAALETHFRQLCSPLLDDENTFNWEQEEIETPPMTPGIIAATAA